jgi:hydroxymethylpyrimidine/phosphomethylpyrimidine kinase
MLVALTIAGSDSIGGAGIQADIRAMASQGVHAAVALTAVTAQNTTRVSGIFPLPAEEVVAQLDAVLEDVHVSAAKTGMLFSAGIASAVADRLDGEKFPLVVDPVMVAGVGDALNRDDLIGALRDRILPMATMLTPNVPEAEALVGYRIDDQTDVRRACRELAGMGAEAVLLKGGHMETNDCTDTLFHDGKFLSMSFPRVNVRGHGGGCILSSYLAANLAKGHGIWESALMARTAIDESISARYVIGRGVPLVEPLGAKLRDAQRYEVLSRLRNTALKVESALERLSSPETLEIYFALPGAESAKDVGSVAVMPSEKGGVGCGSFGASEASNRSALAAVCLDGRMRAGAKVRLTDERARAIRASDLTSRVVRAGRRPPSVAGTGAESALVHLGFVPDVVIDRGGGGREAAVWLFARTPEELLGKLMVALGRG